MFLCMYTYIFKMCENTPSFENINKVCVTNFSNKWWVYFKSKFHKYMYL